MMLSLYGLSLAAAALIVVALWVASIPLRNVSIVDIFWGPQFVVMAAIGLAFGAGDPTRRLVLFAIVGVWGIRLGIHLANRNLGHGEDRRYAAMREARGPSFVWKSLFVVFFFQALLASIIALPIHAGAGLADAGAIGAVGIVGLVVAVAGIAIEALADWQLSRFKRTRDDGGQVLDTGLWRYSRHPNYFGDAVVWWGLGVIALETGAWYALVGPALMTALLLKVSGVTLLEKTISKRRPEYEAYVRRTSAFVPWFPR